jgi:hypothetical protein
LRHPSELLLQNIAWKNLKNLEAEHNFRASFVSWATTGWDPWVRYGSP